MSDEDFDALAAEFVLGTLTAEERGTVEQLAAKDSGFAGRIAAWERRLGSLEAIVEPIEPPPELWTRIRASIADIHPDAALRLPEVVDVARGGDVGAGAGDNVIRLSRRVRRWRGIAALAGAMAAALVVAIGLGRYRPDLLPPQLQPPVRTKIVEVIRQAPPPPAPPPAPAPAGRFVAVLQRDASAPAFLLTVDLDNRTLTVRRVASAPESGKSYELWLVSAKYPAPRSLGLIGSGEFTEPPTLASYDRDTINAATFAVSLEPEGGSPTGAPTGPVLFTGKLVETTPPQQH